jgi:hypothetical protein
MNILNKMAYMHQLSRFSFCLSLVLFSQPIFSQEPSSLGLNIITKSIFQQVDDSGALSANIGELRDTLLSDEQSIVIALPLPNGELVNFNLTPSSVMADELAIKYPSIRTFKGTALNNPNNIGRFDITPHGFHGMFYYNSKRVFVDPKNIYIDDKSALSSKKSIRSFDNPSNLYESYFSQDSRLTSKIAHKFQQPKRIPQRVSFLANANVYKESKTTNRSAAESAIKTYRIAISAAAEYTEFNGGTVDSAMAEIVTLVNRLNQVYQRDLAIKLELVANNDLLVFTDASADPFANTSDDGEINTGVIDDVIGSANYDIGHVVNTNGGGLAVLGSVCHSLYKGDGMTGSPTPINDAFYIDYVAHEVGHQFGADHTFNGTAGACAGNRVANSAYEVGSGSTIMAYAGICDDQNLQFNSDAFFHGRSIDQVNEFTQNSTGSTCGTVTGQTNNKAVVDAGLDYTIPAYTPFKLSGSAGDLDSANLSYSWQQFDLGTETSSLAEQIDNGNRPLFRALLPSSEATRYFPKLVDVLSNTSSNGESLPTTNRELNFRLMVLDNEGGVSFDEVKLTVVDTSQAFALTSPTLNDTWATSTNTLSWQVADTNNTPINCSAVDVLLSKDGGENFDITLAGGVANNGSNDISIEPFCANDINTTQARIKLACNNNIFFAVNEGAFNINKALSAADIAITGQQTLSLTQGESIELTSLQFTYACEAPDLITIEPGDNYSFTGTTITPNSEFSGLLSVGVTANKGSVNSETFTTSISVEAKSTPTPVPVLTPEPAVTKSSGSMFWLLIFVFIQPWRVWLLVKTK